MSASLSPPRSLSRWSAGALALCFGFACGRPPAAEGPANAGAAAETEAAPAPLLALTSEEQRLRGEVEAEVSAIAELGPRSLAHSWNLHTATDHVARRLETYGYEVTRQGFPVGDEILQNLEVVLPGAKTTETVVIAARYDTAPESPGANASASGAAVLLSLAKELVGGRYARTVRLVWLSNESGGTGLPGSAVYALRTQHDRVPVVATLTLGSLGYYSLASGSQRYPEEVLYGAERRSRFGDFVAVVSNAGSHGLLDQVRPALAEASLPVEELVLPDNAPLAADGPQARFWRAGLSGLVLTDTAQFRSPHHDGPLDTPDKLDFDRLARVARLLESVVLRLAGAPDGAAPETPPRRPPRAGPAPATPPVTEGVPLPVPSPEPLPATTLPPPAG